MIFVTWFINKYKGEPLWKMRLCLHNNNVVSFLLLYIHILQKWEKLWNPRKKEFIITMMMMMMMRRLMKTWSVWVITGAVSSSFYLKAFILMVWWWPVLDLMMVFTHGAAFSDRSRCTCPPVWPIKVWGLGGSDGCCRSSALSSQPASLTGWGLGEGLIKAEEAGDARPALVSFSERVCVEAQNSSRPWLAEALGGFWGSWRAVTSDAHSFGETCYTT